MHPESLQTPGADCFSNITTKSVLLACPVYSSLVLFGLRDGGKSQGGLSRIPPRLQTRLAVVFVCGSPGGGTHQEMVAAQTLYFANPRLATCRWGWVGGHRQLHRWRGDKWRGHGPVLWLSQVGGISGCSVSPPQLSPHLSSPSLLQPEPLVLAPSGTPHGAGSHRWALGGRLDR